MEAEPEAFHAEVRAAFLRRAAAAPDRYLVLEADRPRNEVAAAVVASVLDRLGASRLAGVRQRSALCANPGS